MFQTVALTNATTSTAGYNFTLYTPIDHIQPAHDTTWSLPFDVYVQDAEGDVSTTETFDVAVTDAIPIAGNVYATVAEEGNVIIRLSQDAIAGTGEVIINGATVASGASANVLDGANTIGTVLNNGDGTLKFTPSGNYSNYNAMPTFTYGVTDDDGDSATGTVLLTVTPVTDTPTWSAHSGATTNEDTPVALNLVIPTITDNTDQNVGAIGDHGERLGYITLESIDTGAIIYNGAVAITTGSETSIKIVIVDSHFPDVLDTDTHYSDCSSDPAYATAIKLTAAEFAALQILPTSNKHNDIDMTLKVTSYEVDDSGNKLSTYVGKEATLPIHVEVLAITDPITLFYNVQGAEGGCHFTNYTHVAINEGSLAIDIGAILDATAVNGDHDGSEIRSYTVSGIPEGTVVTIGGVTATVAVGQTSATVNFPDNTVQDPTFTMKLPDQFGGQVNATITLNVQDTDSDSSTASPIINTQSVTFDVYVTPVADVISVAVNQVEGLQDAGRTIVIDPVTGLVTSETINSANGLPLVINVSSDDKDGSETYNVIIGDIPIGTTIYYNGTEQVISSGSTTITGFSNIASLKLIPPLNNNADFVLKVTAQSVEIGNGAVTNSLPI